VSSVKKFVAVAVIRAPRTFFLKLKEALPLESVVTLVPPIKVLPSASPLGLEKNWMVKGLLGVLLSSPFMTVVRPEVLALLMTGVFWRLLDRVSTSPVSLRVGPSGLRSMP
jgi:hypothetical protein